jgi:hypothetical protein
MAKIEWNFVSIGREAHILDWLYIMGIYKFFKDFQNFQILTKKSKRFGLRFYRKMLVYGKNRRKLCISQSWSLYYRSIILNSHVHKFLRIKKIQILAQNLKVFRLRFYAKSQVHGKNWLKLRISWPWSPYSESIIHNSLTHNFL